MSRTVTALYDTPAEAEAARQRLTSSVDVERVKVLDNDRSLNDYHMSSNDRQAYGEGIRRGGALLCAEVDGHEDADKIVRALEETASVDLDQRQESWRQEGWTPTGGTGQQQQALGTGTTAGAATAARAGTVEEEHIPIVQEELRIGKREVERGGARVRSYVREVPVHEQVTLREEHVHVERRPVAEGTAAAGSAIGSTAGATGDMLRERTIEMVEKAEEAVVQKVAQVREEVVVSKTSEERTEQIDDTVRHTEVEIDENPGRGAASADKSAFGGFGSGGSGSTGGQR